MKYNTKLSLFIKNIKHNIQKKMIFFEIYFAKGIFFLFLGFLLGNLFGSFLNIFRELIIWNGFIIIIVILVEELISYLTYHSKKRTAFFAINYGFFIKKFLFNIFSPKIQQYLFSRKRFLIKSLNLFKVGVLLGFFVDAFKVGS
jgi:hypothetical protein